MSVYLPYVARVTADPDEYSPSAVAVATVCLIVTFLTGLMGLWPVWGWFTAPIMVTVATGLYKTHHFLPGNFVGIVLQIAIACTAAASPRWIPHGGQWHNNPA